MDITINKEDALRKLANRRAARLQVIERTQTPDLAYRWYYSHEAELDLMRHLGIITGDEHAALRAEWAQHRPKPKWLTIRKLTDTAHDNAVEHGFWETKPEPGTLIALIHSELSEALEELRAGRPALYHTIEGKPEGWAVELADAVIRIADWCGAEGIDLESIIREKMAYNRTRPYKHGKAF